MIVEIPQACVEAILYSSVRYKLAVAFNSWKLEYLKSWYHELSLMHIVVNMKLAW